MSVDGYRDVLIRELRRVDPGNKVAEAIETVQCTPPKCLNGIERMWSERSSVRADYATSTYPGYHGVNPMRLISFLAGGKSLRIVPKREPWMIPDAEMRRALKGLLNRVGSFGAGAPYVVDGVGFPALAFAEFIQLLLFWPAIICVGGAADGAVDVVDCAVFNPPEQYREGLLTLLAGDDAGFFRFLTQHFNDPHWTLWHMQRTPGRAEMFLAEVSR